MGKLWILQPDLSSRQCCGCAGKSGPCDPCTTCSGWWVNNTEIIPRYGDEQILPESGVFADKFVKTGPIDPTEIVISDTGSSIQTFSSLDDYRTDYQRNYFGFQVSVNSGERITLYCEDFNPTPQLYFPGTFFNNAKQSAGSNIQITFPDKTNSSGFLQYFRADLSRIDAVSGNIIPLQTQTKSWLYADFFGSGCRLVDSGVNPLFGTLYTRETVEQKYSIITGGTFLSDLNITTERVVTSENNTATHIIGCTNYIPSPNALDILPTLPSQTGFAQATYSVDKIYQGTFGLTPQQPEILVKSICVDVQSQNNGYIQLTSSANKPINIKSRLVKLNTGEF